MEVDQKSMSLADIIKKDKAAGKGDVKADKFGKNKNKGRRFSADNKDQKTIGK